MSRDFSKYCLYTMLIKDYTINDDLTVDVNISNTDITNIPIQFDKVNGFFHCSYNKLTSLESGPIFINGYYNCSNNNLTSLKGSSKIINGL